MRKVLPWLALVACSLQVQAAHADDAVYRCESASGVSIQSTPCPKGATQRKINFQRPVDAPAPPVAAAGPAHASPPQAPLATIAGHPVTPPNAMHGPNEPYPLWQCMRGDGSTYDSRDGIPGRQWVVAPPASPDASDQDDTAQAAKQSAALASALQKKDSVLVRPYEGPEITVAKDDDHRDAPPPGAGPGQWVADQCTPLPPDQACKRYAARRDALRRQIYAARPSDRSLYAPEEQDLTSMLYAACGM